jgi:hypothetical protein
MLGLADVHLVRQVQPVGADAARAAAVASYQGLAEAPARRGVDPSVDPGADPGADPAADPVPAVGWTWLSLRLELPGSRNRAWARRSAAPVEARGGGRLGAARTLDKAARTAAAKLGAAGFVTTRLSGEEARIGLAASRSLALPTQSASGSEKTETIDALTVPAAGVVLGLDPARQPVVLALFRRRATAVSLVAGLHLGQVLALRAAAVGARVIIETARPDRWDPVVLHSGLDSTQLTLREPGRVAGDPAWPKPAPTGPLLVIRDCGARPPYTPVPYGPWVAVVTLLPDPRSAGQLGHADLAGFQRVPEAEAVLARRVLGLSEADTEALSELPVDTVLLRTRARNPRRCEITGTDWELRILGPAHR